MMRQVGMRVGFVAVLMVGVGCGDEGGEGGGGTGGGGACGSSFSACGGDIVGSWKYTDACVDAPITSIPGSSGGENPYASCADKPTIKLDLSVEGTANFRADGTFRIEQTSTTGLEVKVPNSCLDEASMGRARCADLGGTTSGSSCVLEEEPETSTNSSSGTYTVEGTKLRIVSAGTSSSNENVDFCVKGNTLTVRLDTGEGTVVYYTAVRQ